MRENQPLPAQQLRSVAYRYQRRTRAVPAPRRPIPARQSTRPMAEQVEGGRDERMQRLEAVLFLAKEPLHSRKLSQYANLADGTEARTLASRLNDLYDRAGCAFRVEEVAGGLQLRTRPQFGRWLRRLQHVPGETRLSAPAMETLSVVAYRQPVMRADIEAVRGVACGEILRQLMERDLVTIVGRSEELGRPYLYGTTKKFLQLFGLRNLNDLPRADVFRESHRTLTNDKNTSNDPTSNSETSEGVTEVSATLDQVMTTTESVLATRAIHDAFAAEDRTLADKPLRAVDEDEWEEEDEDFDDDDDDDDEDDFEDDEEDDFEDEEEEEDDEEFEDDEEESEWEEVEDEDFEDEEEFDEELDDEELDDEELDDEELDEEEEDWDEEEEEEVDEVDEVDDEEDDEDWDDDDEEEEEEEEEDWE